MFEFTTSMEAETKLHDCESGKTVTIIADPGSERTSSFDRDMPRIRTASTVSRGAEEIERKYKIWLRAEIVGLVAVIIVVWGLLLLPVIFYHLPQEDSKFNNNVTSSISGSRSGMESCDLAHKYIGVCSNKGFNHPSKICVAPTRYTGTICQEELRSLKSSLLGDSDIGSVYPLIVTESKLEAANVTLPYIKYASQACAAEVKPFLCLYFFGLYDATEKVLYQSSACHCRNLRDNVCAVEWKIVTNLPNIPALPNCDLEFSEESVPCHGDDGSGEVGSTSGSSSGAPSSGILCSTPSVQLTCSNITCREGFYCENDANNNHVVCNPSCYTWNQHTSSTNTVIDFLVLMSACIGVVSGVGVLVVAGIRWKKVLVFPSSLTVYQTITLLVLAFFVIVNYMDNSTLYCTSENLYDSLKNATTFCIITGVVYYYSLLQLTVFWFCNVLVLFWKIQFPFHSRSFQIANRVTYIHITVIALCILVPFIPIIATMSQHAYGKSAAQAATEGLGFGIARFPPIFCLGRDPDTTFYSLILPILVILIVGMTMLITLFWIIHKQHGLFKARQSRNPYKIGTAERKLLIVFVYYVVLAVVALTAFTLIARDKDKFISEFTRYFACESTGPDEPCPRSYIQLPHIILSSLSYIILGLFPVVNLIFVISVRGLKKYLRKRCTCLSRVKRPKPEAARVRSSGSQSSSNSTQSSSSGTP